MFYAIIQKIWIWLLEVTMPKVKNTKSRIVKKKLSEYGKRTYKKRASMFRNERGEEFKEGDMVKLTKKAMRLYAPNTDEQQEHILQPNTYAEVVSLFPDIVGLVRLNNKLGGYWTWDVNDLQKVRKFRIPPHIQKTVEKL